MPTARATPDASPATVALWRDNLRALRDALATNPDSEWRWLWEIRADIIEYLLKRYVHGDPDHTLAVLTAEPTPAAPHPSPAPPPTSPEPYRSAPPTAAGRAQLQDALPPPDRLRDRLRQLQHLNEHRHAVAERDHRRALERNAAYLALARAAWEDAQRNAHAYAPPGTPISLERRLTHAQMIEMASWTLSEDEVLAILNGAIPTPDDLPAIPDDEG